MTWGFILKDVTCSSRLLLSLRMLLRYAFSQLRSTQVATVHCSAQTSSRHVLQKLSQTCLVISSNTGRVYRPKDCERLVLYLKDINLPKPDKWGTSNLIAFLQQVQQARADRGVMVSPGLQRWPLLWRVAVFLKVTGWSPVLGF